MKLKYYLRGLGVGIILTVILMMIGYSGKKNSLSDEEIIERARGLGMVMKEEQVSGLKDAKKQNENQDTESAENENQGTEMDNNSGADNETKPNPQKEQSSDGAPEGQQDANPEGSTGQDGEADYVAFEVARGEYSDTISQKLFEAGLISDADVFNNYLVQGGIDSKILVGLHNIPKGSTPEEIARILCEKPVDAQ